MRKFGTLLSVIYGKVAIDLPRRSIQVAAFAVVVIGVVTLASGDSWGLVIFSTGCYFVAHPFDGHPVAGVLTEIVRRRWGGPGP